jgi:MoaA/NifB/PqqE/SkfB family radical SAM enzyme
MALLEAFEAYGATRAEGVNTGVLCHAPFVNLNFSQNGTVTACCYNRQEVLGVYPSDDVASIWNGRRAREFRDTFLRHEPTRGCELCFHQLRSGNLGGVLMRNFDRFSTDPGYEPRRDMAAPQVLEFEIANTCNLQCVMCDGEWSSAIRAGREGRPPLHSPYDGAFVEQLAPFLPSIRAAKFLGGEPFLIARYYEIWERLLEVNPSAELSVTTNGTRVPPRARALLEGLRVNIVVSLDSLDPATFERIRPGARFDEVMANIETFAEYAKRRGTDLAIAVCPMQSNWQGLPDLARFCADRRLWIHFNTVTRPPAASLASLPVDELGRVIDSLERRRPEDDGDWWTQYHLRAWDGLVNQLRTWHARKVECADRSRERERELRARVEEAGLDEAGPVAVTDAGRQALSFVIRGYGVGQNLSALESEPIELARLLADAPALAGAEAFGSLDLLRALLWLDRVTCGTAAADPETLDRCLARIHTNGGSPDALHGWLKERMRRGQWATTARWLKGVLDVASDSVRWEQALAEGLAELRARGLNDGDCRIVGRHLASIVPFAPLPWPDGQPVPWLETDAQRSTDEGDLERIFDAMCLFCRGSRPAADQDAFRRRLDSSLALIRDSGLEREVRLSFAKTDLLTAFDSLVNAADDQLAGLVEQARAMTTVP